jgi:hypothetical protein
MTTSRSHFRTGVIFVGACVLIGVALFVLTRLNLSGGRNQASTADNATSEFTTASETVESNQTAVANGSDASVDTSKAQVGNCEGGTCSWSITLGKRELTKGPTGVLIELSLLGGSSDHPDGNYPDNAAGAKIGWDRTPHSVWVYCSPVLPAVMINTDSGLQTDVLPFKSADEPGVPGVLISSARLYMDTCYSDVSHDPLSPPDLRSYRTLTEDDANVTISDPRQITAKAEALSRGQR